MYLHALLIYTSFISVDGHCILRKPYAISSKVQLPQLHHHQAVPKKKYNYLSYTPDESQEKKVHVT
jgi:hypothetical protein